MKNYPIIAICYQSKIFTVIYLLFILLFVFLAGVIILLNFRGIYMHWFIKTSLAFWIFCILWSLINMIYTSPTLWIHEEGLTVVFPFRKLFVAWDEIVKVRQHLFTTDIFFRRLTIFNLLIGLSVLRPRPMIRYIHMRGNHKLFLKMVNENIPDKLK